MYNYTVFLLNQVIVKKESGVLIPLFNFMSMIILCLLNKIILMRIIYECINIISTFKGVLKYERTSLFLNSFLLYYCSTAC